MKDSTTTEIMHIFEREIMHIFELDALENKPLELDALEVRLREDMATKEYVREQADRIIEAWHAARAKP